MSTFYDLIATAFSVAALIICVAVTGVIIAAAYFETRGFIVRHRERVKLRRPPYDHQLRD